MILSRHAIEDMGFIKYPDTDILEVELGFIRLYCLEGINLQHITTETTSKVINFGSNFSAVVSQSINKATEILINNTFTDDEDSWTASQNVRPPFVLVYFRENCFRQLKGGFRKLDDDRILTYGALTDEKKQIKKLEDEILPGIVTALTVHLSKLDKPVQLVSIYRDFFGMTKSGAVLTDVKLIRVC